MHLLPRGDPRDPLTGLESEHKGPAIHLGALTDHATEDGEGRGGKVRSCVASDHGVVDVGVGIGDLSEEELGVANVAGVSEGAEGEDAARWEAVGDEACAGHVRLDLAELGHGGAGLHEGEDGVGDAEIGVEVPFGLRAKGGRGRGRGEADNRSERRPPHLAGPGREWGVWRTNFIIAVELYSVRAGDHKWPR